MKRDKKISGRLLRDKDGATSVEYAIIASLIAAVIAVAVSVLGVSVLNLFTRVTTAW